jgi:hypothetical protein
MLREVEQMSTAENRRVPKLIGRSRKDSIEPLAVPASEGFRETDGADLGEML